MVLGSYHREVEREAALFTPKFASDAVRRQVEEFQAGDFAKLSTRKRGKLVVLDVGARITSTNQKMDGGAGG